MQRLFGLVLLGSFLVAGSAAAQPDAVKPPEPTPTSPAPATATVPVVLEARAPQATPAPRVEPRFTVMWAPLRLVVPLVEATVEYRVADKIGASITVGGGKRTITNGMTEVPGTEIEGGAQARYYAIGDFDHGMELGIEALYERVRFEEPLPAGVAGVAAGGLTIGPFIGYKVAAAVGFTFEAQLGARYLAVDPPVQGSAGMAMIESRWLPILHLNIGWSF